MSEPDDQTLPSSSELNDYTPMSFTFLNYKKIITFLPALETEYKGKRMH